MDESNALQSSVETYSPPNTINHRFPSNFPPTDYGNAMYQLPAHNHISHRHLRCQRCNGLRSTAYHEWNALDPATYPAVGVCSRRHTGCLGAVARTLWYIPELPGS
ncbi:uncharacterized protein EURHEDRAFT_412069 [Aspergillus ruber CBS 135680]|uniref:Uncharacterized protein n=1 Tax=Aspergillus ruber (strain CBS 135680) TaxID=1388766 RepID=A0A017SF36_ASPRC|nr:uncharacterized protein EURHEDRAFT_412069 [Aspergillus ruber CBS 135680]EYE95259.1 hypothetical protein EURHEDRAFT_412069 [Aspergillus ruber CBS 135680]